MPESHDPGVPREPDVTELLVAWCDGDQAALDRLMPLVYAELRRVAHRSMRGEPRDQPLQTTALVNEAYLRLVDISRLRWQNRAHFFAVSAQLMRRILVDAARERRAQKRGNNPLHVEIDVDALQAPERGEDLVALDDALTRLATFDARKARIVELRYFGGLTADETAEVLGISKVTVARDWKVAKLWLVRELTPA